MIDRMIASYYRSRI